MQGDTIAILSAHRRCSTWMSSGCPPCTRLQKTPTWPRWAVSRPVQRQRERLTTIASERSGAHIVTIYFSTTAVQLTPHVSGPFREALRLPANMA